MTLNQMKVKYIKMHEILFKQCWGDLQSHFEKHRDIKEMFSTMAQRKN